MPATLRKLVENLVGERAPGPTAAFSVSHLLLALELIAEKSFGRNRVGRRTGRGRRHSSNTDRTSQRR
jgi:ParB-like chromosome segregation protein Spo0J